MLAIKPYIEWSLRKENIFFKKTKKNKRNYKSKIDGMKNI